MGTPRNNFFFKKTLGDPLNAKIEKKYIVFERVIIEPPDTRKYIVLLARTILETRRPLYLTLHLLFCQN